MANWKKVLINGQVTAIDLGTGAADGKVLTTT